MALRFRTEYGHARAETFPEEEYVDRPTQSNESEEEKHLRDGRYAREKHLKSLEKAYEDIRDAFADAELLSGENLGKSLDLFYIALKDLRNAAFRYYQSKLRADSQARNIELDQQQIDEDQKKVIDMGDPPGSTPADIAVANVKERLDKYYRVERKIGICRLFSQS